MQFNYNSSSIINRALLLQRPNPAARVRVLDQVDNSSSALAELVRQTVRRQGFETAAWLVVGFSALAALVMSFWN